MFNKTEEIKKYFENSYLDDVYLEKLYSNYLKLLNLENTGQTLNQYEESIYTIKGKKMSNLARIKLELSRILKRTNDLNNRIEQDQDIKTILKILPKVSEIDSIMILYIKKYITKLQIEFGLNITFFEASKELLYDEYKRLLINDNLSEKNIDVYTKSINLKPKNGEK